MTAFVDEIFDLLVSFDFWCRHPLQELVVDTFVPNDAYIIGGDYIPSSSDGKKNEEELSDEIGMGMGMGVDEEAHSVVVCTGANACGKVR